jgi:hypothetical protein
LTEKQKKTPPGRRGKNAKKFPAAGTGGGVLGSGQAKRLRFRVLIPQETLLFRGLIVGQKEELPGHRLDFLVAAGGLFLSIIRGQAQEGLHAIVLSFRFLILAQELPRERHRASRATGTASSQKPGRGQCQRQQRHRQKSL